MCDVISKLSGIEKVKGYKIVAIDTKSDNPRYYSVAMGFCYQDYEYIPEIIPRDERRTSKNQLYRTDFVCFFDEYLEYSNISMWYNEKMKGRTGIFVHRADALSLLKKIVPTYEYECKKSYYVGIKYAELSGDLWNACMGNSDTIIGSKIKFLE